MIQEAPISTLFQPTVFGVNMWLGYYFYNLHWFIWSICNDFSWMFFSVLFFCEHSLFAPPNNLQIFRVTCFYFEILFFFSCGFIVILSRPHDVETFCICYRWGIIVVWSYSCFSKGFQARSEVLSILFLEFKIVIALLRGSYYKHYPHWLTSL
jgi:hypothetical protein